MNEILDAVIELQRESHRLWDESFTNLVFCNPTHEQKRHFIQQSYEATQLHSEAIEKLKQLQHLNIEMQKI